MKHTLIIASACLALGLGATACQRDDDALVKELRQTNQKLDAMDKKIDALAASGGARAAAARPSRARPERKRPTPGTLYAVPVNDTDPFRGAKHAKVTIVEAFEFACPYCAIVGKSMDETLSEYEPGDVKLVAKNLIIHPQVATDAALGACAAQAQGKFEAYEKALWKAAWKVEDRPSWKDREALKPERLHAMAKDLGMNVAKFKADMASDACKQQLAQHRREMMNLGVSGTPGIFINGKYYVGQRTPEALKAAIDAELEAADAAIAKGVKLEDYYASLVKQGKKTL